MESDYGLAQQTLEGENTETHHHHHWLHHLIEERHFFENREYCLHIAKVPTAVPQDSWDLCLFLKCLPKCRASTKYFAPGLGEKRVHALYTCRTVYHFHCFHQLTSSFVIFSFLFSPKNETKSACHMIFFRSISKIIYYWCFLIDIQ